MADILLRPDSGARRRIAYGTPRRLFNACTHAALLLAVLLASGIAGAGAALAAPLRVLTFGDSLSAGYGVAPEESFPARLEAALRKTGLDVVVKDASVSGDTTAGGLVRLNWGLQTFGEDKPDLVIVELGANDMLRGLDPTLARQNLDTILSELKSRDVRAFLAGMRAAPNFGPDYVKAFDAIYPELAAKFGVPLYPFFLDGVAGKPELIQPDGLHPNPRGVDIIVAGIAPRVAEALKAPAN